MTCNPTEHLAPPQVLNVCPLLLPLQVPLPLLQRDIG